MCLSFASQHKYMLWFCIYRFSSFMLSGTLCHPIRYNHKCHQALYIQDIDIYPWCGDCPKKGEIWLVLFGHAKEQHSVKPGRNISKAVTQELPIFDLTSEFRQVSWFPCRGRHHITPVIFTALRNAGTASGFFINTFELFFLDFCVI